MKTHLIIERGRHEVFIGGNVTGCYELFVVTSCSVRVPLLVRIYLSSVRSVRSARSASYARSVRNANNGHSIEIAH